MNKIKKRILLIIVIVFVLFAGVTSIYYYPMIIMPRVETGQVPNTNVYSANAMSAVFFVKAGSDYIMIDGGLSAKTLLASMEKININPNDVKWIFLTHSDGDHVNGITAFPNAKIYMSEDEFLLINGTAKRTIFGGNPMPSGIDIDNIGLLPNNQELLLNGTKIQCIKMPGHTIGAMVYLIDGKYLFSGDTVKIKDGDFSVHPYSMDKELSNKSIEKLKELSKNCSLVLTSHYGYFSPK